MSFPTTTFSWCLGRDWCPLGRRDCHTFPTKSKGQDNSGTCRSLAPLREHPNRGVDDHRDDCGFNQESHFVAFPSRPNCPTALSTGQSGAVHRLIEPPSSQKPSDQGGLRLGRRYVMLALRLPPACSGR